MVIKIEVLKIVAVDVQVNSSTYRVWPTNDKTRVSSYSESGSDIFKAHMPKPSNVIGLENEKNISMSQ